MFTFPVTQLVKSTKDNTRLDMLVLDEEKKKKQTKFTFAFTSVHVRETFCQQIMQMKNMHSSAVDVDQISVFVGTWNMGKKNFSWYWYNIRTCNVFLNYSTTYAYYIIKLLTSVFFMQVTVNLCRQSIAGYDVMGRVN